jgi:hypothetical protein
MVILLGIRAGDTESAARSLAEKCVHLRIFADENGKFNRSLVEAGGGALVIRNLRSMGYAQRPAPRIGKLPGRKSPSRCTIVSCRNCAGFAARRRGRLRRDDVGGNS